MDKRNSDLGQALTHTCVCDAATIREASRLGELEARGWRAGTSAANFQPHAFCYTRFTFHASRGARSTSIGCRVILAVPAAVTDPVLAGRRRECRIEGVVGANQFALNCLALPAPLGRPPQGMMQAPRVASRFFVERAVTASRGKEKTTGVESGVPMEPASGTEPGGSVDGGSGCGAHAQCRLLLRSARGGIWPRSSRG